MRGGPIFASASPRYVPDCSAAPYRPTGFLRSDAEFRRATYYGLMSNIACEHGIPVGLFDAMIIRESQYQPNIYSPKNAFGLTQLRSEEHTSELQSLMRISYAVFCLKKKN